MNKYALIQALGQLQRRPYRARFEACKDDPARAQAERLRAIVSHTKATEFARKHHVGDVRSLRDLQTRLPIQDGSTLRPFIEREMRGERHVLCAEKPLLYACSSGTTGEPKLMPTTNTFRREFQTSLLTSMAYVYERHKACFEGSVLYYVAKKEIAKAPDGTPIGYTSGFNFSRMPRIVKEAYAVPYEAFEIADVRARCYIITLLCALSPVSIIGAIFPLVILELLRAVQDDAGALIRDLEEGTIRGDLRLTGRERAFFERYARVDRRAADRIRSEAKNAGGKLTATALFPNLRMLYCWTSASAGHYVRELRSALPEGVVVADGVYAANEGWNNVPLGDGMLGGPVAVHGHVYEFIEESAWEAGSREGCGAAELEPGKRYRVVVTTSAGVFRYDLGDVVKCTGFYGRTPRIHFDGRAAGAYNLAGEKMHESHVREAMDATTTALGLAPLWFAAVPNPSGKPRWELFAEFADVPAREALRTFRTEFERRLADSCTDYRLAERLMRPLALHILLPGTTDKLRAQATAQSKWLHLDSNREKWDKVPVHTTIEKE